MAGAEALWQVQRGLRVSHSACAHSAGLVRPWEPRDPRGGDSPRELVVCEGDETGQELLEQALRVLETGVLGVDVELIRFDLSLENRRKHRERGRARGGARPCVRSGLGLKAATITPEKTGDVGSPNRILREGVGGSVIVRTGRRIPGVSPLAPVVHPIVVVRMAVGDAYGADGAPERDARAARTSRRGGPRGSIAPSAGTWRSTRSERRPARGPASTGVRNGPSRPFTREC